MSVGSAGTANPLGSSSQNSLWNNPQLLGAMLPNYNISALDQAMQSELNVDAIPLSQMAQQVSGLQSQASAWNQLQTDLQNLQSDANTLAGQSLYQGLSASSSNPSDVTATATGTGPVGSYQVSVKSLMAVQIVESASQTSDTSALGYSGSFSINGTSISISSTDTLQQLASAINNAAAGVTATVLQPNTGGYVLNIAGTTGQAMTWSDPNSILQSLGVLTSGGSPAHQLQGAAQAQYTVNGVSEQSPTNSDSTSIPGVTLNFLQGSSSVTITTSQNQSAVVGAAQQLATDYNTLLSDLNKYTGQGGLLEGSGAVLGLSSSLYQTLTNTVSTQPAGFQSLAQIGITISAPVGSPQNLKMSVNSSTLQAALTQNPAAVASLLDSATGVATQLQQQLNGYVGASGTVPAQISQLNSQISSMNNEINNPNSYVNQIIQAQNQQLQNEFNNMITALLQSQSQGQAVQGFLNAQFGNTSGSGSGGSSSGG